MSTQVDNRVVEMTFDNAKFEKNVKQSMESIKKLDEDLKILENASYLKDLDKSIKNFSLDGIATGIETLNNRFSTMGIIGMTVISRLTNKALDFGSKMTNSFLSIAKTGGLNRALNIEQAEFQLKGLGMDVAAVMEDVNYAVDGTAYGLDAAAKTASQFGASGVQAGDKMKAALRGVSGVAAMTGAEYEDIGRIFATVAGNGRLFAQQLNQIGARGINAAAALAKYLGVSETEVRKMTSQGKIDFDTFAAAMDNAFGEHAKEANNTFQGALSNMKAAMNRIGADFAQPYIKNMRDVFNAVRPWLNNLRTALKPIATDAENIMIGMNKRIVKALGDDNWVDIQINAVEIFRNSLRALLTVLYPIGVAWKEAFPNFAIKNLKDFTSSVREFTANLGFNSKSMANLRDTFKGLFSILSIFGDVGKGILSIFFPFTKDAGSLLEVVLTLTGAFGRLVSAGIEVFQEFGGVSKIFEIVGNGLLAIITTIGYGIVSLYEFASNSRLVQFAMKGIEVVLTGMALAILLVIEQIDKLWHTDPSQFFINLKNNLKGFIDQIKELKAVQVIMSGFSKFLSKIGVNVNKAKVSFKSFITEIKSIGQQGKEAFRTDGIVGFFKSITTNIVELVRKVREFKKEGGVFGGIAESGSFLEKASEKIKAFLNIVKEFISGLTPGKIAAFAFSASVVAMAFSITKGVNSLSGLAGSIKGFFGSLTSAIKGIKKPKSALQQFAEAIAILSASLVALTLVDPDKLNNAAKAIGLLIAEISGIGIIFSILSKFKLTGDFESASRAMITLSGSVLVLTIALRAMNGIEMEGIGKKLLVMLGVMASLATMATLMAKFAPKLTKGSIFMLAFSFATANVIKALATLESVNLEEMGDRITALFIVMAGLAILAKGVGSVRLTSAVGLFAIVAVLNYAIPTIKTIFDSVNIEAVQRKIEDSIVMFGLISALAIAMGFAFEKFGSGIGKLGIGLLGLSGAILILTQVPKLLKEANLDDKLFSQAMKFIAGMMGLFGVIILATGIGGKAGKNATKLGIMALEITASILLLSLAAHSFGEMDDKSFAKAIGAVDSMLLLFAGIIACTKFAEKVDTKVMLGAIVGIVVLMGELVVLSLLNWNEILPAAASMALVLLSFSESLRIISQAKIKTDNIKAMVAMALIVAEFAVALSMLAGYKWDSLLAAGASMSLVMLTFAEIVKTVSSRTGLKNEKLQNLVVIAFAMLPLAGALAILARNDWSSILAAGASMSAVMYMFTEMLTKISSRTGLKAEKVNEVIKMALAMVPIGVALSVLANGNDWSSILAAAVGMSLALIAITGVMSLLGKIGGKDTAIAGAGIMAASIGMIALAKALQEFTKVDWNALKEAAIPLGIIIGTFVALGVVVGIFKPVAVGLLLVGAAFAIFGAALMMAGAGILMAGSGLSMIIPALQSFTEMDLKGIGQGLLQLAPGLAVLSLLGMPLALAGPGMLAAGVGLNILIPALQAITNLDLKAIGEGLMSLAPGLLLIGIAGAPLAIVGVGLAVAFTAIGAALLLAGAGIALAGVGLNILIPALQSLVDLDLQKIGEGILKLAPGLALLGLAGIPMMLGAIGILGGALALLALVPAVTFLQDIDLEFVGQGLISLAAGAAVMGAAGILLAFGAPGIIAAGLGLISFAAGALMLTAVDLSSLGNSLMSVALGCAVLGAAGVAMLAGAPGMLATGAAIVVLANGVDQFAQVLERVLSFMESNFLETVQNIAKGTAQAGVDAVKGLVEPISKNLGSILDSGKNMAKSLLDGIREEGGWHSPWTETEKAGVDAVKGLEEGSEAEAPKLKKLWQEITEKGIIQVVKDAIKKVKEWFKGLGESASQLGEQFGDLTDITSMFATSMDDLLDTEVDAEDQTDNLTEAYEGLADGLSTAGGAATKTQTALEKLTDTISNQMDIFSKFDMKTEISAEQMLENMRSQIQGVSQWANNLQVLAERGIDQGLLAKLTELGPQGYEKVAAFVQMTDEQLAEAGGLFAQSLELPKSAAEQILGSFALAGRNASQGFVNGLDPNAGDENARLMGENALTSLNESLDIHSPSGKTYETGMNMCLGLLQGLKIYEVSVLIQVHVLCMHIIQKFYNELSEDKFYPIAAQICAGLATGITENTSVVTGAIGSLVSAAISAAESGLEIHSPSRKFWRIGKYSDEGMAKGILDNTDMVEDAIDTLGTKSVDRFNNMLKSVSMIFDDRSMAPVIKPTLDLSNVISGVDQISGMFEQQRLGVNGYISGVNGHTPVANQYTFNQYNTSPKALSQIDIYRNTNNQISKFRRKMEANNL